MDRRKRHIVVMCIAVVTASLASAGVYVTIKRIPVREVEIARRFAVVAARPLPTGVRLTAQDVKLIPWPASSMVPGSFSRIEAVENRALLSSVVENEPLTDTKLAGSEAGAGLSPSIPRGMRAITVKVNDVIGVAGFLDSGTRVDLVVTIRKRDDSTSRTVVSNVPVLTAGTRADQQNPNTGKAPSAAVVTLLVTPEDAERIALAQSEGQIMLVLRNPLDNEPTATSGVRTAALLGPTVEEPRPVAPTPVRRKAPVVLQAISTPVPIPMIYKVEAIRAAKRTEEVVGDK